MDDKAADTAPERAVTREIEWSRRLFERKRWPVPDVTKQAVEETGARILRALGLDGSPGDA